MTVMADRSGRPAPVRRRMKTLTQAALNADKTVEQVGCQDSDCMISG